MTFLEKLISRACADAAWPYGLVPVEHEVLEEKVTPGDLVVLQPGDVVITNNGKTVSVNAGREGCVRVIRLT